MLLKTCLYFVLVILLNFDRCHSLERVNRGNRRLKTDPTPVLVYPRYRQTPKYRQKPYYRVISTPQWYTLAPRYTRGRSAHRTPSPNQISNSLYAPLNEVRPNTIMTPPKPIESSKFNSWAGWSAWSACSKSCGGGKRSRKRVCKSLRLKLNSSADENDVNACPGSNKDYTPCNTLNCLSPKQLRAMKYDSRKSACAQFNSKPYLGDMYEWLPYLRAGLDECRLTCLAKGFRLARTFGKEEAEGVVCGRVGGKHCRDGRCVEIEEEKTTTTATTVFPAPHKPKVKAEEYKLVEKRFQANNHLNVGYNTVFTVPMGAVNFTVQESTRSKNYLALRTPHGYVLNGGWRVEPSKTFFTIGSKFVYTQDARYPSQETIFAPGPLLQDLTVALLFQQDVVDLKYSYKRPLTHLRGYYPSDNNNIPLHQPLVSAGFKNSVVNENFLTSQNQYYNNALRRSNNNNALRANVNTTHVLGYKWQVGGITQCSKKCGGGEQEFTYRCFATLVNSFGRRAGKFVDNEKCKDSRKPKRLVRMCNQQPCPTKWNVGSWSTCSQTCGQDSYQERRVECKQTHVLVPDYLCTQGPKPVQRKWCQVEPCYFAWKTGEWTECSASCGSGRRMRKVTCQHARGFEVAPSNCGLDNQPRVTEECEIKPCAFSWFTGSWSKCNSACGQGSQTRHVICTSASGKTFEHSHCIKADKPATEQSCHGDVCAMPFWVTTAWSECTTACGEGTQHRAVFCMDKNQNHVVVESSRCPQHTKPEGQRPCLQKQCSPDWFSGKWSECSETTCMQSRQQICLSDDILPARGCMFKTRPDRQQSCRCHNDTLTTTKEPTLIKNTARSSPSLEIQGNSEEFESKEILTKGFSTETSTTTTTIEQMVSTEDTTLGSSEQPTPSATTTSTTNTAFSTTQQSTTRSTMKAATTETSTQAPIIKNTTPDSFVETSISLDQETDNPWHTTSAKSLTTHMPKVEPTTTYSTTPKATSRTTDTKSGTTTDSASITAKSTLGTTPSTTISTAASKPTITSTLASTATSTTSTLASTATSTTSTLASTATSTTSTLASTATSTTSTSTTTTTSRPVVKPVIRRLLSSSAFAKRGRWKQQKKLRRKNSLKNLNIYRPYARLAEDKCFDLKSQAYCTVISKKIKFCHISRFKASCCKSCLETNS